MFFRFLLVGGSGFLIDACVTYLLIQLTVAPWLARIPAILLAMVFTWLANRRFTYDVKKARTKSEAMRYATVAAVMAFINYLIYVVLVSFGAWPVLAVLVATICQAVMSFNAYRYLVFRDSK